jgi:hypothetical protein
VTEERENEMDERTKELEKRIDPHADTLLSDRVALPGRSPSVIDGSDRSLERGIVTFGRRTPV